MNFRGFPSGSAAKNLPANAGDAGDASLIPRSGRSLGGGHGNPMQYSCLENLVDRGAWQATAHGVAEELDVTSWLNNIYKLLTSLWAVSHSLVFWAIAGAGVSFYLLTPKSVMAERSMDGVKCNWCIHSSVGSTFARHLVWARNCVEIQRQRQGSRPEFIPWALSDWACVCMHTHTHTHIHTHTTF